MEESKLTTQEEILVQVIKDAIRDEFAKRERGSFFLLLRILKRWLGVVESEVKKDDL